MGVPAVPVAAPPPPGARAIGWVAPPLPPCGVARRPAAAVWCGGSASDGAVGAPPASAASGAMRWTFTYCESVRKSRSSPPPPPLASIMSIAVFSLSHCRTLAIFATDAARMWSRIACSTAASSAPSVAIGRRSRAISESRGGGGGAVPSAAVPVPAPAPAAEAVVPREAAAPAAFAPAASVPASGGALPLAVACGRPAAPPPLLPPSRSRRSISPCRSPSRPSSSTAASGMRRQRTARRRRRRCARGGDELRVLLLLLDGAREGLIKVETRDGRAERGGEGRRVEGDKRPCEVGLQEGVHVAEGLRRRELLAGSREEAERAVPHPRRRVGEQRRHPRRDLEEEPLVRRRISQRRQSEWRAAATTVSSTSESTSRMHGSTKALSEARPTYAQTPAIASKNDARSAVSRSLSSVISSGSRVSLVFLRAMKTHSRVMSPSSARFTAAVES